MLDQHAWFDFYSARSMKQQLMTYYRDCNWINTTGVTSEAGTAYPSVFSGVRVTRSLVLDVCFVDRCLSFCTFSFGHCVVHLYVLLRYTDSDYPFGIFKLFF